MNLFFKSIVAVTSLAGAVVFAAVPADAGIGIGIGIGPVGVGIGIGPHGGVGFDIGTGGYCDHWGCPGGYWDYPVYYGPVYYEGGWYEGPVYYREMDGEYWYWVHGGWHRDEWRGERPEWAREAHYGPALGRDYYKSDEFRHGDHRYHGDDWDHHEHNHQGHSDHGDHHEHGDHGDHHDDGDHGDH